MSTDDKTLQQCHHFFNHLFTHASYNSKIPNNNGFKLIVYCSLLKRESLALGNTHWFSSSKYSSDTLAKQHYPWDTDFHHQDSRCLLQLENTCIPGSKMERYKEKYCLLVITPLKNSPEIPHTFYWLVIGHMSLHNCKSSGYQGSIRKQ